MIINNLTKHIQKTRLTITPTAFFLFILIGVLIISNIVWIKISTAPPWWDQSWYLHYSQIFYHSVSEFHFLEFFNKFATSFRVKAPLISALPLPLYLLLGNSHDVALSVNIIMIAVFNIFIYKLLIELKATPKAALLAALITSTMPLVFGLSRHFMVEYSNMTLVTIWLYLLVKSKLFTKMRCNILLGIFGGLGMLLKSIFPIYILGPTLIALILRIRKQRKKMILHIGTIFILVAAVSSTWYYHNLKTVMDFMVSASIGALSKDYSAGAVFSWPTIKNYWHVIMDQGISYYYFFLFLALIVFILAKSLFIKKIIPQLNFRTFFFASWFLFPAVIFTLGVNKDFRFIMPAMPAFAAMTAMMLSRAFTQKFAYALPLLMLMPIYSFFYTSFNFLPKKDLAIAGKYHILQRHQQYTFPPKTALWPHKTIVNFIQANHQADPDASKTIITLVVISIPEFNHNNFAYYNSMGKTKLVFGGTPQDKLEKTTRDLLVSKYLITKEGGDQGVEFINRFNPILKRKIRSYKLPYEKIGEFPLPDGSSAFIYKRLFTPAI